MDINPNPAQTITADTTETFKTFSDRVFQSSKRILQHGNGQPIELEPGAKYAVLALKLAEIATPQQFEALFGIILQAVGQATASGIIPPDWFQGIATLFDILPPEIPAELVKEGREYKVFLTGNTALAYTETPIPEVEIDEPQS
jgi:hypothetical protein